MEAASLGASRPEPRLAGDEPREHLDDPYQQAAAVAMIGRREEAASEE